MAQGLKPSKCVPLVNELKTRDNIETIVCVTGQHRQMLDQVLEAFHVVPNYDLSIMKDKQTLFDITTNILNRIKAVLDEVKPDVVLVHGDTSTTFVTALACFYLQIPVGHVEAGLRTYNIYSPYPEEFNRQAVSIISQYNFAPTELSKQNLLKEGKKLETIYVTGNTAIDALKTTVREDYSHPELDWAKGSRLILITAHRRENLGEPMKNMFRAIRRVMDEHPNVKAIYPIHMNPVVRQTANEILGGDDRIHIIEPLDVLDFHNFMARSYMILTDSGGIQEEAPSLGKPVLVMRDTTERPEGIAAGTLKLVGTDEEVIYRNFKRLLENPYEYAKMSNASNPYGDGFACKRIANVLCEGEKRMNIIQRTGASIQARFIQPWKLKNYTKTAAGKLLAAYKDIYTGQRCFLIGNGPSLRAEDLTRLHEAGEITFAFNRVYNIFEQTPWRPTFYISQDEKNACWLCGCGEWTGSTGKIYSNSAELVAWHPHRWCQVLQYHRSAGGGSSGLWLQ